MRVVVAGGAGYVGSRLCPALAVAGHDVLLIDRDAPAPGPTAAGVRCLRLDVGRTSLALDRALEGCNVLIDLVGLASVPHCAADPGEAVCANTVARVSLVEALAGASRRESAPLYVFTSTVSALYDRPSEGRTDEEGPLAPRTVYGYTKLAGERLACHIADAAGLRRVVLRLANVFGPSPRMRAEAVIPHMIADALSRGFLAVQGSGRQTRSFLYIDDLTSALRSLVSMAGGVAGGVYNLGGEEVTIHDLARVVADTVADRTGVDVRVQTRDEPTPGPLEDAAAEARPLRLSWDRARKAFGYESTVGLNEGVGNTLDWILAAYGPREARS